MSLETKATEYLQSQQDIIQKPEYLSFLKQFDTSENHKERYELIKNNEKLLWAMENMIKPKVDLILQKNKDTLTDDEAKLIITYNALNKRWFNEKIPKDTVALHIQAWKGFDTLKNVQFLDKTLETTDSILIKDKNGKERSFNINMDKISFKTNNTNIDKFLTTHKIDKLLSAYEARDIYKLEGKIWKSSNITPEQKQIIKWVSSKDWKNNSWEEVHTIRQEIREKLAKDPQFLTDFLKENRNSLNNISTEEMYKLKEIIVILAKWILPDIKSQREFYWKRGDDLRRDDGISTRYIHDNQDELQEEVEFSEPRLEKDNFEISADGKSIVNKISGKSVQITKEGIIQAKQKEEENIKNNEKFHEYMESFEKQWLIKNSYTKEQIDNLDNKEQWLIQDKMQDERVIDIFTKNREIFNISLERIISYQDENGIGDARMFNKILQKIDPTFPIEDFDCTTWNTTMNVVWDKIILKQWSHTVELWFNSVKKNIKILTPEERNQREEEQQTQLLEKENKFISKQIDVNNPTQAIEWFYNDPVEKTDRQFDMMRAFDRIDHSTLNKDWTKEINLSWLHLSANDVVLLNQKIAWLEKNENKWYVIDLSSNNLDNIPQNLLKNNNITDLVVNSNNLESLPKLENIKKEDIQHLKWISISNNNFRSFPDLQPFTELEHLSLSDNRIWSLKEIATFKKLTYLSASDINISEIPEGIGELWNLNVLNLWWNAINKLPSSISKLKSLTQLHLGNNRLNDPIDLSFADNLKDLSLYWNEKIKTFPILSEKAVELEGISVGNTNIKNIPFWLQERYKKLKDCNIYNDILNGKDAINKFLDWSLTEHWYNFTPSTKEVKTFFEQQEWIKYTTATSIDQAKEKLWIQWDEQMISAKKTIHGRDYFYVFTKAIKNKDYL